MLHPLTLPVTSEIVEIGEVQIEVQRCGQGAPLLLLPGEEGLEMESPFLETLASRFEVIILRNSQAFRTRSRRTRGSQLG